MQGPIKKPARALQKLVRVYAPAPFDHQFDHQWIRPSTLDPAPGARILEADGSRIQTLKPLSLSGNHWGWLRCWTAGSDAYATVMMSGGSGSGDESGYEKCVGPYVRQCRRVLGSIRSRIRTRSLMPAPPWWQVRAGRGDALSLSLTLTHPLSHTNTHSLSLTHTHSLSHTHPHTLSLSLSHTHRYGRDVAMLTDLVRCTVIAEDLRQVTSCQPTPNPAN